MLDKAFINKQKKVLLLRKISKINILQKNGEQALLHSQNDITRIEFALKRIEAQQYGLCANCGIPINRDRLEVIPETPFCKECAEQH